MKAAHAIVIIDTDEELHHTDEARHYREGAAFTRAYCPGAKILKKIFLCHYC